MRTVAGSSSEPGYTFIADPNTGLYRPGADRLRVVTGGTDQWEVDSSGHLWPVTDNARDLGKTGNEIRDLYLDGTIKGAASVPTSYTPALTATTVNPNLGSTGNEASGFYYRPYNKRVEGHAWVTWGTVGTSFGTGSYLFSLPSSTDSTYYNASTPRQTIGTWTARDSASGTVYSGIIRLVAAGGSNVNLNISAGGSVGPTNPFTMANGSNLFIEFRYWEA